MIGATCLHIASKCEEVVYISPTDLCYCGDNKYTPLELARTERILLSQIDFRITQPTVYDFVTCFLSLLTVTNDLSKSNPLQSRRLTLTATYIAEIALHGSTHLRYPPSLIATCVVSISLYFWNPKISPSPPELEMASGNDLNKMKYCWKELWADCASIQTGGLGWDVVRLECVRKKYAKQEKLKVAEGVCFKRVIDWECVVRRREEAKGEVISEVAEIGMIGAVGGGELSTPSNAQHQQRHFE